MDWFGFLTSDTTALLPFALAVRIFLAIADKMWVAPTQSGHVESSSLKKQHARAFKTLEEEAAKNNEKAIRPFVLYSLRHTFLTRLGESGCDAWTLARIAGHGNVSMSSRYVHPSEDAVLTAMSRLGGHKIGHSDNLANSDAVTQPQLKQ